MVECFEADYRRIYGLTIPDVGLEVVTWRLSAYAEATAVEPQATLAAGAGEARRIRLVRFDRTGSSADTPVYRRADLAAGQRINGPAIIEERETTAVIRAGWTATVAPDGSVIAERTEGRDVPPEGSAPEGGDR